MSSPPVSNSHKQATMNANRPKHIDTTVEDTSNGKDSMADTKPPTPVITPSGSDDEAYASPQRSTVVDSLKNGASSASTNTSSPPALSPVSKVPVVPYKDRANTIIESITDSDKKILRLYEENAVIGGPFPVKLQIILKVTEILGQQHIISWLPHGRSFMIHRPREFEEKIMGEFFKQTKLSSFKRQLNLYDFQRVTSGTDCGSYYHEMFLRGKPLLAKRMIRRKIKGTKGVTVNTTALTTSNTGNSDDRVPDFYSMPFVGTNRSGLDLQQANSLMRRSSIPGMGMPSSGAYDSLLNRANELIAPPSFGAAPGGLGGLHAVPGGLGGMGGLQAEAAFRNHHQSNDLSLNQLQQFQYNNGLMNTAAAPVSSSSFPPPNVQSSYAAAMEKLNNSYALAASALRRDLEITPEELVAARHFNRQAASLGGLQSNATYNFNHHAAQGGW